MRKKDSFQANGCPQQTKKVSINYNTLVTPFAHFTREWKRNQFTRSLEHITIMSLVCVECVWIFSHGIFSIRFQRSDGILQRSSDNSGSKNTVFRIWIIRDKIDWILRVLPISCTQNMSNWYKRAIVLNDHDQTNDVQKTRISMCKCTKIYLCANWKWSFTDHQVQRSKSSAHNLLLTNVRTHTIKITSTKHTNVYGKRYMMKA